MPKFNIDRIRQIIGEINFALSKLETIRKINEETFLKDNEKIDSAKYNLIVIIEGAIDICNHIVARAGGRAPHDYADCFAILEEIEIFSTAFAEKLKRMAKFRNLLVHLYGQVDNHKVFAILREDISDIKKYLRGIENFIERTDTL